MLQSRLLTTAATAVNGSFPPAPIMSVLSTDGGKTFLLNSSTLGGAGATFNAKVRSAMTITRLGGHVFPGQPFRVTVTIRADDSVHSIQGTLRFVSRTGSLTANPSILPLASPPFTVVVTLCCAPTTAGSTVDVRLLLR